MKRLLSLMAAVLLFSSIGEAKAGIINTIDRGWYENASGFHIPSNDNYFTGNTGGSFLNDFFVFNLAGQSGPVTSATFSAFNPSTGNSISSPEIFTLYEVTTPIATLVAGGSGLVAIHTDLGNGTVYGSVTVNPGDFNQFINVTLNSAGLAAINSNLGGQFAFGGSLGANPSGFVFGNTGIGNPQNGDTFLNLQSNNVSAVPEPATMTMLGIGVAGMFGFGLRRRRANTEATPA